MKEVCKKKNLTITLSDVEWSLLEDLSRNKGLSKTAILAAGLKNLEHDVVTHAVRSDPQVKRRRRKSELPVASNDLSMSFLLLKQLQLEIVVVLERATFAHEQERPVFVGAVSEQILITLAKMQSVLDAMQVHS